MGNKWPGVLDQIHASQKKIALLPVDAQRRGTILTQAGLSRGTILGTVVYNCGGLVIEDWLRVYGCGELDFVARNQALGCPDRTLVAEDVVGGLFACGANGTVDYFAPDNRAWEPMHLPYDQFLDWCLRGNTKVFYEPQRWTGWETDAAALTGEQGIALDPPLHLRHGMNPDERARSVVPMLELLREELTP